MTYKTFLSATWCFHKYQVHTLEVPNAFLHPKRWDRVTLTKEYTHNEHHCLKQLLLQTYIQVQKLGRKVGLCIDKVASKGPIVVTKSDATRRDHNLLLFKLNSQFHTIRIPLLPFTNQKPHHRGNRQDWIASKNTYPLTSPKWEYPQATFKQHWCAQLIDLKFVFVFFLFLVMYTPLQSKGGAINWHYKSKEATRYKLKEQESGEQRGGEWRREWRHHSPHSN